MNHITWEGYDAPTFLLLLLTNAFLDLIPHERRSPSCVEMETSIKIGPNSTKSNNMFIEIFMTMLCLEHTFSPEEFSFIFPNF
jgi:hypothetical protein